MKEGSCKGVLPQGGESSSSSWSPCAACKLLRRRCSPDCVFAPHFPGDQPHKFANVHKVFGASNISKMLQELPAHQREDAVCSMVYEANARVRDPIYGCTGAISSLQQQLDTLRAQLAMAQAEIVHLRVRQVAVMSSSPPNSGSPSSFGVGSHPNGYFELESDVVDQPSNFYS
ncbi:unnamed protein product [Cuscuta europaea]|uniref:LOB domain-containing protein n=2 Tax=Cuscuta europaea TaxID=41803 RepID=A0A9P0ZV56_CUSEU|nr:unnamed protein product [Cuscuta europaea]